MVFFLHIPLVKQVGIMLHHLSEAKEGNKRQHTSEGTMGKNRAAFSDVPCTSTPPSNRESVNCAVRIKCATCQTDGAWRMSLSFPAKDNLRSLPMINSLFIVVVSDSL